MRLRAGGGNKMTEYNAGDPQFHSYLDDWSVKWDTLLSSAEATLARAAAIAADQTTKLSLEHAAEGIHKINAAVTFFFTHYEEYLHQDARSTLWTEVRADIRAVAA